MDPTILSITLISFFLLTLICSFSFFKWLGIFKLKKSNSQRIKKFKFYANFSKTFSQEKHACQIIFDKVDNLNSAWFLPEDELNFYKNGYSFLSNIAYAYHPNSKNPILEVRVGKLIKNLKILNLKILDLLSRKSFRKMADFRLKHILIIQKIWKKKQEYENSWWGETLIKSRFYFLIKWTHRIYWFFDIGFWALKTFTSLIHHFAFKTLITSLYLDLGELGLSIYREDNEEKINLKAEDLEKNLESSPIETGWTQIKIPTDIKTSLEPLRREILLSKNLMNWESIKIIFGEEFKTVAEYYYPKSENPIYEVKLYNSLAFLSQFLQVASSLEKRPEIKKILNFRIAQAIELKDRVDSILEFPIIDWLRKYNFVRVAKVAKLAFQTIKKKHPGFILKDLFVIILIEGSKRWFYIFLFDKIAEESCKLYGNIKKMASSKKEISINHSI